MRKYFYKIRIIYLSCLFLAFCFVFISSFASGFSITASAVVAFLITICGGYVLPDVSFKECNLYDGLSLKTMVFYKSMFFYYELDVYQKILVNIILRKRCEVDDVKYEIVNPLTQKRELLTIWVKDFKLVIDFCEIVRLFFNGEEIYKCNRIGEYSFKEEILQQFEIKDSKKQKAKSLEIVLKQKYKELKTKK